MRRLRCAIALLALRRYATRDDGAAAHDALVYAMLRTLYMAQIRDAARLRCLMLRCYGAPCCLPFDAH